MDDDALEKLAAIQQVERRIRREVRSHSWGKSIAGAALGGVITAVVTAATAAWTVRGYIADQHECVRKEIKASILPIVEEQNRIRVDHWLLAQRVSVVEGMHAKP